MKQGKKTILPIFLLLVLGLVAACSKEELPAPETVFTRIYDNPSSDLSYFPVDFMELSDGGHFILAQSAADTTRNWLKSHIIRTDKLGEIIWQDSIADPLVSPIGKLCPLPNDEAMFLCMNEGNLAAFSMHITKDSVRNGQEIASVSMPLAISPTSDNGYLVLGYNRRNETSQLTKLSADLGKTWQKEFKVGTDVLDDLINHLKRTGRRLPLFTGEMAGGVYYASMLYNYSVATIFVDLQGAVKATHYAYHMEAGYTAVLAHNPTTASFVRTSYGDHYFQPFNTPNLSATIDTEKLEGVKIEEIAPDSENKILTAAINGTEYLIIAGTSNTNQVVLFFYDMQTQEYVGKKTVGFANPISLGNIKANQDGGLTLLYGTNIFGRFNRVGIQKIPKEQLSF